MLNVSSAQKQEDIIKLLEAYDGGDFKFKYEGRQGIRMKFSATGDSAEAAAKAKALIKAEPWARALFFNVAAG